MKNQKDKFIEFALENQALQFGKFTLKSGRISPYFFNAAAFQSGEALKKLGEFYADLYQAHQLTTKHLFGPAYKGILLSAFTSLALAERNITTTYTFNRKEQKSLGEKSCFIGAPLSGPTTIIDDVITAGTAFREALDCIEKNSGQVHSVLIALDRCERGLSQSSALSDIRAKGIQVYAIISVFDIIDYLKSHEQLSQATLLEEYQRRHAPIYEKDEKT